MKKKLRELKDGDEFIVVQGPLADRTVRVLRKGPHGQCYARVLPDWSEAEWWRDTPVEEVKP